MTSIGIMASSVVPVAAVDVLMEPFNNFTFAPWTLTGSPSIVTGRTGTAASTAGTSTRADYTIPSANESDTITIGFAYRPNTSNAATRRILELWSDTNGVLHNRLNYNGTTGGIEFTRDTSFTLATSAGSLITVGAYQYIELQAVLHDSAGAITVRVNGTPVITATGLDTRNVGTKPGYDTVRLGAFIAGLTNLYDDLYITTGAGAAFKGNITIP